MCVYVSGDTLQVEIVIFRKREMKVPQTDRKPQERTDSEEQPVPGTSSRLLMEVPTHGDTEWGPRFSQEERGSHGLGEGWKLWCPPLVFVGGRWASSAH